LIGLGVLAYVLRRQRRRLTDIGLSFRGTDIPKSLIIALVGYVAFFVVFNVLPPAMPSPGAAPQGAEALRGLASARVVMLIVLVLVNPLYEELICRAYPMGELETLTGSKVVAVVCSAGVQGYYHLYQGWRWAVASTALFLVLSLYFASARRAVPIVLAHFYFDALGIYFLFRAYSSTTGSP
jgi:membrane protease YdiL (CAAX protease family)